MKNDDIELAIDLLFRLPRIMRRSMQREIFAPSLKSLGGNMAPHHMVIMKILDDEGTMCISALGEMAEIAKAQMTHSVDKLTSLGMLERVPDTEDRRKTDIRLTPDGKKQVARMDRAVRKRMSEKLSWLQDDELKNVMKALEYLVATFEKL